MEISMSAYDDIHEPVGVEGDAAPGEQRSGDAERRPRVIVVDDEDELRCALARNLADENFEVVDFGDGHAAIEHLQQGAQYDVLLLDWMMPTMAGIDVLRALRRRGINIPVIVLTAYSNEDNEVEALDCGAIDFLDKSRSPAILVRRLRIIVATERKLAAALGVDEIKCEGVLELHPRIRRAFWRGERVPLTVTEFDIVNLLASKAGMEVSYREIYDVVHGTDFVAGDGSAGYRINVRALIKRIRQKFHSKDPGFSEIENYAGFGYCWRSSVKSDWPDAREASSDAEKGGGFWNSLTRFAGIGRPSAQSSSAGPLRDPTPAEEAEAQRNAAIDVEFSCLPARDDGKLERARSQESETPDEPRPNPCDTV
jgi:two-component system response regulator ChvI